MAATSTRPQSGSSRVRDQGGTANGMDFWCQVSNALWQIVTRRFGNQFLQIIIFNDPQLKLSFVT
jgi:hypothetical protein